MSKSRNSIFMVVAGALLLAIALESRNVSGVIDGIHNGISYFAFGGFDLFFQIVLVGLPTLALVILRPQGGVPRPRLQTFGVVAYVVLGFGLYLYFCDSLTEEFVAFTSSSYAYQACQKVHKTGRGNLGSIIVFARTDKGCEKVPKLSPFASRRNVMALVDELNGMHGESH